MDRGGFLLQYGQPDSGRLGKVYLYEVGQLLLEKHIMTTYTPVIPQNLHLVAPAGETPQHQHDCSDCIFLGRYGEEDLYIHLSEVENTVIARFGSDGPAYSSGLCFSYGQTPRLTEARHRAEKLGLHQYNAMHAMHYATNETERARARDALKDSPLHKILSSFKDGKVAEAKTLLRAEFDALAEKYSDVSAWRIMEERVTKMGGLYTEEVFDRFTVVAVLDKLDELAPSA
jgi:hypothetical protein